jgi:Tc5 transposase DNA-binding domain
VPEPVAFTAAIETPKTENQSFTQSSKCIVKRVIADSHRDASLQSGDSNPNLSKRAPALYPATRAEPPVVWRDADVSISLEDDSGVYVTKKRGRNLLSTELENHILDKIKHDWKDQNEKPNRGWITKVARNFISKNNVNLKCSKGWLDKFMKRNSHLLQQREGSTK